MSRLDPVALDCLIAVVDEGGFQGAARRLGISQSAVSQRVKALEQSVGSLLVVRTRPVSLTDAGRTIVRYGRRLGAMHDDLSRELGQSSGSGRIRIALNADSLATWALDALDPLVRDGVDLEIVVDDESRTIDRLRHGDVLGCVAARAEPVLGATVRWLGAIRYQSVASPAFADRFLPHGLRARDLATTPFLVFGPHDPLQHNWVERAFRVRDPILRQRFVPSSDAYVRACVLGWGVAVIPLLQSRDHLAAGRLVVVHDRTIDVDLHWHAWPSGMNGEMAPAGAHRARSERSAAPVDLLGRIGDVLENAAKATLYRHTRR